MRLEQWLLLESIFCGFGGAGANRRQTKSVSTEPPGDRLLTVTPVSGRSCAQANVMVSSEALVGP